MEKIKPFVITISRQLGCGGSYVGQQLAKKLNIRYVDREIISKAAEMFSVLEEDLESRDEKIMSVWQTLFLVNTYQPDVYLPKSTMLPTSTELFDVETEIIKSAATGSPAVIIGRCGFHILKDAPNHISVFLYGDKEFRNKRIQSVYNVSEEEANKMITKCDNDRAHYCKSFTGKEWTNLTNYDLSVDTSKTGIDNSVKLIIKYLKYRRIVN